MRAPRSLGFAVSRGELDRPEADDPQADSSAAKARSTSALTSRSSAPREERPRSGHRRPRLGARCSLTADAIRSGSHDVVYQGVVIDPDGWRGVADFIERQADGSYEVSDTKLARHSKPYFLLQLSFYSEQLGRVQGRLPERMHVVLGTNDRESFRVADFIAYYRRVRARFLEFVEHTPETYPLPVEHCQVCAWKAVCEQRWIDDDHLSLVANMRRSWIAKLGDAGITTLEGLALAQEETVGGIRPEILERISDQARMQFEARTKGHDWKLLPEPDGLRCCLGPPKATSSTTSRANRSTRPRAGSSTCMA